MARCQYVFAPGSDRCKKEATCEGMFCTFHGGLPATGPLTDAVKYDQGKTKFSLLPWDAVREVADVFTRGAQKYEERNWEKGLAWSRIFDSTQRHLSDWFQHGMTHDPDGTGLRNLAQAAWGCLVLLAYELRGIGTDDRPTPKKETEQ